MPQHDAAAVAQIADLEKRITVLEDELEQSRKELYLRKSLIAPITDLPVELLIRIFLEAHASYSAHPWPHRFPYLISHVCRHWRDAALQTAALWTRIGIRGSAISHKGFLRILRRILSRSGEQPIHCFFDLGARLELEHVELLMSAFASHTSRWQTVSIRSTFSGLPAAVLRPVTNGLTPRLERLYFSHAFSGQVPPIAVPNLDLTPAVSLSTIEMDGFTSIASVLRSGLALREVTLKHGTIFVGELYGLLESIAPSLQTFSLVKMKQSPPRVIPNGPRVRMPTLSALTVQMKPAGDLLANELPNALFAACMDAPALKKFTVSDVPFVGANLLTQWCAESYPQLEVMCFNFQHDAAKLLNLHDTLLNVTWFDMVPPLSTITFQLPVYMPGRVIWMVDIRFVGPSQDASTERRSFPSLRKVVWVFQGWPPCAKLVRLLRDRRLFPTLRVRARDWPMFQDDLRREATPLNDFTVQRIP